MNDSGDVGCNPLQVVKGRKSYRDPRSIPVILLPPVIEKLEQHTSSSLKKHSPRYIPDSLSPAKCPKRQGTIDKTTASSQALQRQSRSVPRS